MPSGAKKRKAAKKKKEKENTINPQGNGELKSQDEKGSDGSEGSSPAHHDHDAGHHHPFNGGNKVAEEGDSSAVEVEPTASDAKSMEEVPSDIKIDEATVGNEASVVMIERVSESGKSSDAQNVSFEHIQVVKELYHGNGNAGGTSNDKSLPMTNSEGENFNSIEEAVTCHELVDSSSSKITSISKNAPIEESGDSAVESSVNPVKYVVLVSDTDNNHTVNVLQEKSDVSPQGAADLVTKINENNAMSLTNEKARILSLEEPNPKEYDSEVLASSSTTPSTKLSNGAEHVEKSETPVCSENQPLVASAPPMVLKTTLLSCCGLFEVLLGSK